jgi:hypothetical protein
VLWRATAQAHPSVHALSSALRGEKLPRGRGRRRGVHRRRCDRLTQNGMPCHDRRDIHARPSTPSDFGASVEIDRSRPLATIAGQIGWSPTYEVAPHGRRSPIRCGTIRIERPRRPRPCAGGDSRADGRGTDPSLAWARQRHRGCRIVPRRPSGAGLIQGLLRVASNLQRSGRNRTFET